MSYQQSTLVLQGVSGGPASGSRDTAGKVLPEFFYPMDDINLLLCSHRILPQTVFIFGLQLIDCNLVGWDELDAGKGGMLARSTVRYNSRYGQWTHNMTPLLAARLELVNGNTKPCFIFNFGVNLAEFFREYFRRCNGAFSRCS